MEKLKNYLNYFKYQKRNSRGLTILEVIIASSLIAVGMTAVFFATTQTIRAFALYPSELIAGYLAQEGIEIVRNIRDTNWTGTENPAPLWNEGLSTGTYRADYNDYDLTLCSVCDSNYLKLNPTTGFYESSIDSETPIIFVRKIEITQPSPLCLVANPNDCFLVTVTVFWTEKGKTKQIIVRDTLYKWH